MAGTVGCDTASPTVATSPYDLAQKGQLSGRATPVEIDDLLHRKARKGLDLRTVRKVMQFTHFDNNPHPPLKMLETSFGFLAMGRAGQNVWKCKFY